MHSPLLLYVVRTSKTRFVRSFSFLFFRSEECSRTNCVSSSSVAAEEHHHSNMTPIFLSFFASSCEPINKRFLPYVGQQRSRIICAWTFRSFSHLTKVLTIYQGGFREKVLKLRRTDPPAHAGAPLS